MPSTFTGPISALPNGYVATNTALSQISVDAVTENMVSTTLGGTVVGDGNGGTYYFQAASTRPIDNSIVLGTPTTGRWICIDQSSIASGVGPVSSSLTGYAETFVVLSGFAPLTYALPPSVNVIGELVTVKTVTTGTVTLRPGLATDVIFNHGPNNSSVAVSSLTSTLTGGYAWNFRVFSGAYYRVDTPFGTV